MKTETPLPEQHTPSYAQLDEQACIDYAMTVRADTPDSAWILNQHAWQPLGSSTTLLASGYGWDAVRTPEGLGLATAERLLADTHDREFLGPVLYSRRSGHLHWLIRPGSTADYPDGCQRLGRTHWIVAPGVHALHPDLVRWLHLPAAGVLTPAVWLAAALHDTRPTGGTR